MIFPFTLFQVGTWTFQGIISHFSGRSEKRLVARKRVRNSWQDWYTHANALSGRAEGARLFSRIENKNVQEKRKKKKRNGEKRQESSLRQRHGLLSI